MLSSSEEYLTALRKEQYLRFLEWPQFIATHYQTGASGQDADDTVNLLIFDWLNHGYCEEDAKKIALLMAVHDLKSRPLRGHLAYALTSISVATFQCMTYQKIQADQQFIVHKKMNVHEIRQLMNSPIKGVDKFSFGSILKDQQNLFFSWVKGIDKLILVNLDKQISAITQLRYILEEYSTALDSAKLEDELATTRLSLVRTLACYLNNQTEWSTEVSNQVKQYVETIYTMQPAEFEKKYLSELVLIEQTFTTNLLKAFQGIGIRLFQLVQPPPPQEASTKSTIILE